MPRASATPTLGAATTQQERAPEILSLIKPDHQKRVLEEREILTSATLGAADAQKQRRYQFYSAMLVRAPVTVTRRILTDYALYSKLISYVDLAQYDPIQKTLQIEGGIWSFKLRSRLQFDERSPGWIRFRIIEGHFRGLEGDFLIEDRGEGRTLVMMRGHQSGSDWPPKFVIERGAEIVFGFTAKRMRTYIESQKIENLSPHAQPSEIPQPRSHL